MSFSQTRQSRIEAIACFLRKYGKAWAASPSAIWAKAGGWR